MKRQLPYHDHCHPGAFCETSDLFQDRLFLEWKPTPKKSRKTLVHKQNIVMANVHQSVNVLLILTDGSRIPDHGTGYSVVGYHMGEEIHQRSIKFADNASNFDAEMYALAQAAEDIQRRTLELISSSCAPTTLEPSRSSSTQNHILPKRRPSVSETLFMTYSLIVPTSNFISCGLQAMEELQR